MLQAFGIPRVAWFVATNQRWVSHLALTKGVLATSTLTVGPTKEVNCRELFIILEELCSQHNVATKHVDDRTRFKSTHHDVERRLDGQDSHAIESSAEGERLAGR